MNDKFLHAIECDCQECLDKWEKVNLQTGIRKDNKNFYLNGKFFEKEEEDFWKEAQEYPKRQITEQSIDH